MHILDIFVSFAGLFFIIGGILIQQIKPKQGKK